MTFEPFATKPLLTMDVSEGEFSREGGWRGFIAGLGLNRPQAMVGMMANMRNKGLKKIDLLAERSEGGNTGKRL